MAYLSEQNRVDDFKLFGFEITHKKIEQLESWNQIRIVQGLNSFILKII